MESLTTLLCSLLSAVLFASPVCTLRTLEVPGGRELRAVQVREGDWVHVQYVHSMYNVKQGETFSIGPDLRFHLEEVTFGSYAAALYYGAEGAAFQDGIWRMKGGGKNYDVLRYRVGPATGHVVILRDQRLELSVDSHGPGALVEVRLERSGGH
jgi:hypothetical protein